MLPLKMKSNIIRCKPSASFACYHLWGLFLMVFSAQHLYIFHSPVSKRISMQKTSDDLTHHSILSATHWWESQAHQSLMKLMKFCDNLNQSKSLLLLSYPVALPRESPLCPDILMIARCPVSESSRNTAGNKRSLRLIFALSNFWTSLAWFYISTSNDTTEQCTSALFMAESSNRTPTSQMWSIVKKRPNISHYFL